MTRSLLTASLALVALLAAGQALAAPRAADAGLVSVTVPATADGVSSVAIEFSLPQAAAAIDARLLFDTSAAELVGVAPVGSGKTLSPQPVNGGAAFGAYDLRPSGGKTTLRVILAPQQAGQLDVRLVIDAAADSAGRRLSMRRNTAAGSVRVARSTRHFAAPAGAAHRGPQRGAGPTRDLVADGVLGKLDLDVIRAAWERARLNGTECAGVDAAADANGDGCIDIVDIQAVAAAQGQRLAAAPSGTTSDSAAALPASLRFTATAGNGVTDAPSAAAAPGATFVVNTTADAVDANYGDGVCADSQGRCTLRAAVTEANWQSGQNRIEFNLSGSAPVVIQLSASQPTLLIQDRSGGVTIDAYSQPGSSVNTAQYGSNAVPGIELRGNGNSPRDYAFRVTSAYNIIRGFSFNNWYRPVFVDTADAHDNHILGNWFGFSSKSTLHSYLPYAGVLLNTGANNNHVGSIALADRNVSRATKAIYMYGPGTTGNVIQNNVVCMTPDGSSTASCSTGIDHDFGAQYNLVGGTGAGQLNVIGRTTLNGVEYSHGWDPSGVDNSRWQVNNNRLVGNWIGFRADGSYNSNYRVAQANPGTADNGNGVNAYDGSNYNVIEGNWISSVYDGIQTMSPNATGQVIRNNIIGVSPLGEAAPVGRYGIVVRNSTRTHFVEGNIIRNTGSYGIGLIQKDVLWVRISRNIVSDTNAPAIYLAPDPSDPSRGANNLLAAPQIASASTAFVRGTASPGALVEVYRASRQAGQNGLPVAFLGDATAAADGSWSVAVTLAEGDRATALQIQPSGNTSALSVNVTAVAEQLPDPPVADFAWAQQAGTLTVAFSDTSTGNPSSWSWDFGDGQISSERNPSHTYAAAGDYTVTLTAANGGGANQAQQTVSVSAPPAAQIVAADSFGRSVSGGWGTADTGGAYVIQGPAANYSVGGGAGTIQMPSGGVSRSALLNGVSARDVDITFRVAANKAAAGANFFVYTVARRSGNNEYRPRLVFNTNGTVSVSASVLINGSESALAPAVVVPGLTQTANGYVWLRAHISGSGPTTISVKAWADGTAEPSAWQFSTTSSHAALQGAGSVGLRAYLSSGTSIAPLTLTFDDYSVTTIP